MMEKKRSVGVIIIALVMLIYSILCLYLWREDLYGLFRPIQFSSIPSTIVVFLFLLFCSHRTLDGIAYLIAGIFILTFKNWARKFAVISSIILFLISLLGAIYGLIQPDSLHPGNFFYLQPYTFFGGVTSIPDSPFSRFLVIGIVYIPLIIYGLVIAYLTRPKVKEQFK
jgi:hypothetical protein